MLPVRNGQQTKVKIQFRLMKVSLTFPPYTTVSDLMGYNRDMYAGTAVEVLFTGHMTNRHPIAIFQYAMLENGNDIRVFYWTVNQQRSGGKVNLSFFFNFIFPRRTGLSISYIASRHSYLTNRVKGKTWRL